MGFAADSKRTLQAESFASLPPDGPGLGQVGLNHKSPLAQRLQYPLIKEDSLDQMRDPTIIGGISLNSLIEPLEMAFKEPFAEPVCIFLN